MAPSPPTSHWLISNRCDPECTSSQVLSWLCVSISESRNNGVRLFLKNQSDRVIGLFKKDYKMRSKPIYSSDGFGTWGVQNAITCNQIVLFELAWGSLAPHCRHSCGGFLPPARVLRAQSPQCYGMVTEILPESGSGFPTARLTSTF